MRETLAPHDLVLVLGTDAFKLYLLDEEEPPVRPGTRVAVVTGNPEEAHRSQAELAIIAPVAAVCSALTAAVTPRPDAPAPRSFQRPQPPTPPGASEPLQTSHVLDAVAQRLPRDAILMEEAPSARPHMLDRIPTRAPLGWLSNGNGGLGFGLSGAIGLRMGAPDRPVVAIVGDGSAMFGIQALWSAARYEAGVLFIVMANGNYGVMNLQARQRGGKAAWPDFPGLDIAGIARGLGCPARRIETYEELQRALDEALDGLAAKRQPLLLEVVIAA
jgi:benzoylformate decarboxylase